MTPFVTTQRFFESMYRRNSDPWKFSSSEYELGRYRAIMQALDHRRYQHAFEPGCSIGVLTAQLASICNLVDAIDISPTAVEQARQRCHRLANVHITCATLGALGPGGPFDLIVFSEIGYYFKRKRLRELVRGLVDRMTGSAILLASHWLGFSPHHLLSGNGVHQILLEADQLTRIHAERHAEFRLDVWQKS